MQLLHTQKPRPSPLDRGGLAVGGLFLAVAAALGWSADPSLGFGPDQIAYNVVAGELAEAWEKGLPLYSEFGSAARYSFAVMLAAGQRLLGDPAASYRLILFASALAYLAAMYVLLSKVLEHRGIAALTSVLSIVQRYTLGTSFWGMGEFQSILPRITVLAVFPLAWLLFERSPLTRRVLQSFVVAGLGLALHLSAVYFYCILLLTCGLYVLWRRAWPAAANLAIAAALLCFALAAVPNPAWSLVMDVAGPAGAFVTLAGLGSVWYASRSTGPRSMGAVALLYLLVCFGLLMAPKPILWGAARVGAAGAPGSLEAVNAAIYARFGWTLFPISAATIGFALLNGGLVAAVGLYELGRRFRRGATERERLAALFLISVVAFSLGLTAALQLYCRLTGRPDMVFELFRAFRFIFLPLYLYLGLFLERVWRERRDVGSRLLLAALVLLLLLPPRPSLRALPDGLKLWLRAVASRTLQPGDPSQRQYLDTLLATRAETAAERERHRDFLELCEWIKRSTPEDAVLMTTDYNFVHHTGRDIMISYAQGAGSARSMATVKGYRAWHQAFREISGAFASRSPERILAAARKYAVDYVVTAADQPALPVPAVHANASYVLYRVEP
jgi:hypothetical protein